MPSSIEINIRNNHLILTPYKCIYWPEINSIILGDLHLGKTAHFRRQGIPIPTDVMRHDLIKLQQTLELFSADRLIVVGDMFHHQYNSDIEIFLAWRSTLPYLMIDLIAGNHDLHIYKELHSTGIDSIQDVLIINDLALRHDWESASPVEFCISAHLHPGYLLRGKTGLHVRSACYLLNEKHLILPAFSDFTGLFTGYNKELYDIYLATGKEVIQVK